MARRHSNRNYDHPESALALPAGKWVGGMVKRFRPANPHVDTIHLFDFTKPGPATKGVLCHCGCLLTRPMESCPACLVWAEKDARLHAEAQQRWANRGRIWQILDARKVAA